MHIQDALLTMLFFLFLLITMVGSIAPEETVIDYNLEMKLLKADILEQQLDMMAVATDIDAGAHSLTMAFFYGGASVTQIERIDNKILGKVHFVVRNDGFGFYPIVCYTKLKQCVILSNPKSKIVADTYG